MKTLYIPRGLRQEYVEHLDWCNGSNPCAVYDMTGAIRLEEIGCWGLSCTSCIGSRTTIDALQGAEYRVEFYRGFDNDTE